ncbi:hypothetical protein NPIL_96951 [Nephila pilipes]|uniref:Uncharacterized protein n=1 Tax=Nephila pilipes TaxID=299642 RepID=A0A8X6PY85_NEPPI|nr:hypothetical protein NPIL_96951 [Nephila pilipes]
MRFQAAPVIKDHRGLSPRVLQQGKWIDGSSIRLISGTSVDPLLCHRQQRCFILNASCRLDKEGSMGTSPSIDWMGDYHATVIGISLDWLVWFVLLAGLMIGHQISEAATPDMVWISLSPE